MIVTGGLQRTPKPLPGLPAEHRRPSCIPGNFTVPAHSLMGLHTGTTEGTFLFGNGSQHIPNQRNGDFVTVLRIEVEEPVDQ